MVSGIEERFMRLGQFKSVDLLGLVLTLAACGQGVKPVDKRVAGPTGLDATSIHTNFTYDATTELAKDAAALANADTGDAVVTLYFGGGTVADCAQWTLTITGEGVKPATGDGVEADMQALVQPADDGYKMSFKSSGALPGLRLLAPVTSKIEIDGNQTYCHTPDRTDFTVTLGLRKSSLHQVFAGVESMSGQSSLQEEVSAPKVAPTDASDTSTTSDAQVSTGDSDAPVAQADASAT